MPQRFLRFTCAVHLFFLRTLFGCQPVGCQPVMSGPIVKEEFARRARAGGALAAPGLPAREGAASAAAAVENVTMGLPHRGSILEYTGVRYLSRGSFGVVVAARQALGAPGPEHVAVRLVPFNRLPSGNASDLNEEYDDMRLSVRAPEYSERVLDCQRFFLHENAEQIA